MKPALEAKRTRLRGAHKRVVTPRFPPFCESPLSYHNLTQTRDRRPLRNGERQSVTVAYFRKSFAVHRQRTATQAFSSTQARHTRVAQLVCALLWTAPANFTYRVTPNSCLFSVSIHRSGHIHNALDGAQAADHIIQLMDARDINHGVDNAVAVVEVACGNLVHINFTGRKR